MIPCGWEGNHCFVSPIYLIGVSFALLGPIVSYTGYGIFTAPECL